GVLRVPLFGAGPLFPVTLHATLPWTTLVTSLGVGLAAGLGATAVTALLYGCEDLFARLPIHWMWWPAIGGVFVGLGGLIAPRALGVGYDVIHDLLAGRLLGATLVALLIACVASEAVTLLVLRRSILTEKLARRGRHLTRDYGVNPLRVLQVEDVMEPPLVAPAAPDVVTYPDELLEKAMSKLLEHELEGLPVASRDDPTRVVGYVERAAILAAWVQLTRDEHTIEEGWLGRLRRAPR